MSERSQTAQWVAKAQNGDRLALAKLLTTYHAQLQKWTQARMEPALKAKLGPDDILQEAYLHVVRRINDFEDRGAGSFLGWVRAIVNHKLVDARRALHRQARDVDREVAVTGTAGGSYWNLLDGLYAESPAPSRVVRREEALGALLASLSDLSESHREVLSLRFLKGLSVGEVAEQLDKSDIAIVALTRRALEKLRDAMDRLGDFTRCP